MYERVLASSDLTAPRAATIEPPSACSDRRGRAAALVDNVEEGQGSSSASLREPYALRCGTSGGAGRGIVGDADWAHAQGCLRFSIISRAFAWRHGAMAPSELGSKYAGRPPFLLFLRLIRLIDMELREITEA